MKFTHRLFVIICALAIVPFASSASAQLITWKIEGLTLGPDAAPVVGQFAYDTATNFISDVNINSAAGQQIVCLNLDFECPDREVVGISPSFFYDISPFGFVPTGALPIGSFSFTIAAEFDADNSFVPPGSPLFLLAVGDLPTEPGIVPIIAGDFGLIEFIIPPEPFANPFNPLTDPHRRMTLGSEARLVGTVPEPAPLILLLTGLVVLGRLRRG